MTHLPLGHVSCGAQLIFHSITAALVRWTPLPVLTMVWPPVYVSHIFVPSQETVWAAKQKNSLLHVFCFIKACLSVFCGITLPISQVFLSCQLFGIENFSSQLKVGHWSVITSAANRSIGESVQSRRRPLLGPSPGWKRLLPLSHLRHYAKQALTPR